MSIPLSVQLYSLREQMKEGKHLDILRQIAAMGYKGVEGAGFYGMTPSEFRKAVTDLGMVVSSNHTGFPTPDKLNECIDTHKALGCDYAITGFWENEFKTLDAIKATADKINSVIEPLAKAGIVFALHNHWMEFEKIDGRIKYEYLVAHCPKVKFEIDTYWASNFGANIPAEQVAKFKDRTPLLHIKDGPLEKDKPHVAVGAGKQDIPAIIKAADPKILKWLVVELDACATDMVKAVADSYTYLVGAGLASGNKPARAAK